VVSSEAEYGMLWSASASSRKIESRRSYGTSTVSEPVAQSMILPGRKTDVADAEWLAELLEHGLLPSSFVPPAAIRELRDLTRYRKRLIQAHTSECQRIHKTLEDAGIKLDSVRPPGRSCAVSERVGGGARRARGLRLLPTRGSVRSRR
jgi:hypothetical protein